MRPDDYTLVSRLKAGDPSAFKLLFETHGRKIYHYAFRLLRDDSLCKDIVQDTFLHFWQHRDALEDDRSVVPYLYVSARRTIIDHWRKAATSKAFLDQLFHQIQVREEQTEAAVNLAELTRIIDTGMAQLSAQQRMIFQLSRDEGLTYQEIADRIDLSRETVKYHLVNALRILRDHFKRHGITYIFLISIILFFS